MIKWCAWKLWAYIKNIVLIFSLFETIFLHFLFSISKIVDIRDIYKSLNIIIGSVMKNPEMLRIIPDHHKTKKCVSIQLKNYLIY